jgi:hypothetical protein
LALSLCLHPPSHQPLKAQSLTTPNREAQKEVQNIALDSNFAIPGDPGFPLNQV